MRLPSIDAARPTRSMSTLTLCRPRLALSLLAACTFLATAATAQSPNPQQPATSTLPATQPTALTAPIAATAPAVTATRPHRAEVAFVDQQLTVRANDSSLHQILSTIARVTGMKITGGVEDQRVFGSYGPGEASTILATLLDGTGVNLLIREDDAHRPTELTLTPRSGGNSSPVTAQDEELGSEQPVPPPAAQSAPQPSDIRATAPPQPAPQPSGPPSIPQPLNNPLGNPNNTTPTASQIPTTNSVPTDSLPTPSTVTQQSQGIVDSPNPPPGAAAPPLTPDQIYQKLLQMQKDKASQASGTTTPPSTNSDQPH